MTSVAPGLSWKEEGCEKAGDASQVSADAIAHLLYVFMLSTHRHVCTHIHTHTLDELLLEAGSPPVGL